MCRASGACVLSTWHVKSTRCISTIQIIVVWCVFRYNISAESPAKSTLSQGHGLSTGGVSIYIYVFCLFLSLSLCLSPCIHPSIDIYRRIARLAPPIPAAMSGTSSESSASEILPEKKVCKAYDIMVLGFRARVYYEA